MTGQRVTGQRVTGDRDTARTAAWFVARLHVVGHHADRTGVLRPLDELYGLAVDALGETDAAVYQIRCRIEEIRDRSRDATASAEAWRLLRRRAQSHLDAAHPTMLAIRSFESRLASQRGRPGDPERSVRTCEEEYRKHRVLLGPDNYRTRLARTHLAVAMRGAGDLAASADILRDELRERSIRYGQRHPFTWAAHAQLAGTLLRVAESASRPADQPEAAQALAIADELLPAYRARFGRYHAETLRIHLLRAQALSACGRPERANLEIRYVQAAARRSGDRSVGASPDIPSIRMSVESVLAPPARRVKRRRAVPQPSTSAA